MIEGKLWNTCQTYGKRASRTLWPVSKGWLAGSFSVTGRTWRTGHTWTMLNFSFTPSNSSSNTTSYRSSEILSMVKFTNVSFSKILSISRFFLGIERWYTEVRKEIYSFNCESLYKVLFFKQVHYNFND
jgi:hypothetical protein